MKIREAKVYQDYLNGVLYGKEVKTNKKLFKDAKHFYLNSDNSVDDDTIMYEVYSYSQGDEAQIGNMNWGLTVLKPVYINGECNITRGHFHEDMNCAEIYFCLHGQGLLLFMDENHHQFAEEMKVGSIHHIDGHLAHRLINTGDDELRVGACWPTTAGHDYERIEKNNFKVRVFKENDKIIVKEI